MKIKIQVLITIFIVVLLFTSCKNKTNNHSRYSIENGILDLRNFDFHDYGLIKLSGNWFFYPDILENNSFNLEKFKNSQKVVYVPSTWNKLMINDDGKKNSGFGYGSYSLKIFFNKPVSDISFKILDTSSSYRLFINGTEYASNGYVSSNLKNYKPEYKPIVFSLKDTTDQLDIVVQVANYSHARGGLWEPIFIGSVETINNFRENRVFSDYFLIGGLLLMILYHLAVFIYRKMEKTPLYLGLFCLFILIRTTVTGERILSFLLDFNHLLRIEYIMTFLPVPIFIIFVMNSFSSVLENKVIKYCYAVLVTFGFIMSLFPIFGSINFFTKTIYIFYVYFSLTSLLIIFIAIRAFIQNMTGSGLFLTGVVVIVLSAANDILYNTLILQDTQPLLSYGLYLFIFFQSSILAKKFSILYYKNQVLSITLENRNQELKKTTEELDLRLEEVRYRHFFDKLTDLPNRNSLFNEIGTLNTFGLIILDINSFKEINDFYGNRVGDEVLKEVAFRLNKMTIDDHNIKVYKLSADEFTVIKKIIHKNEEIQNIIRKIFEELNDKSYQIFDLEIFIQITIGAALSSDELQNTESILQKADMALKKSKMKRLNYLIYDDSMMFVQEIEENINRLKIIRNAIKNDDIVPVFQPIYNNLERKIEKYECLARIFHENTLITPDKFLDIAKKNRYYHEITKAMLKKSLNMFVNNKFEFSINISIDDIVNDKTIDVINQALKYYPGGCERVIFEILESEGIENYDIVKEFIKNIKGFGCKVAIDDFGSGYSNFDHILQLNVDFIKIDASLIKNIHKDRNSQIIVKTISGFAKELNLRTVAEFVHNQEVYQKSFDLGIDFSQGYYFGKPDQELSV